MANLLGKKAALFCASGTMTNIIACMIIASERGDSIIVGDKSHIMNYERGGAATFGGVFTRPLVNDPLNGNLDLNQIEALLPNVDDPHIS